MIAFLPFSLCTTCVYTLDMHMGFVYSIAMIISFGDKETEKVYNQFFSSLRQEKKWI